MPAFQVKLGANDLNYVDVPLNPSHSTECSLVVYFIFACNFVFLSIVETYLLACLIDYFTSSAEYTK